MSSAIRDYRFYAHRRELQARRRAQDRRDAARHAAFDRSAQDQHGKSERAHFCVVTASDAFRRGYEAIRWSA